MTTETKIRPFSSGSEFGAWTSVNCEACPIVKRCDIIFALDLAYLGDGEIDATLAERAGLPIRYAATEEETEVECRERLLLDESGALPVDVVMARSGAARLPGIGGNDDR